MTKPTKTKTDLFAALEDDRRSGRGSITSVERGRSVLIDDRFAPALQRQQ